MIFRWNELICCKGGGDGPGGGGPSTGPGSAGGNPGLAGASGGQGGGTDPGSAGGHGGEHGNDAAIAADPDTGNFSGAATGFGQDGYGIPGTPAPSPGSIGEQSVNTLAATQAEHGIGTLAAAQQGMSASDMAASIDAGTAPTGLVGNVLDSARSQDNAALMNSVASQNLSRSDLANYNFSRQNQMTKSKSLSALNTALGVISPVPNPIGLSSTIAAGLDTAFGVPFGMPSSDTGPGIQGGPGDTPQKPQPVAEKKPAMQTPEVKEPGQYKPQGILTLNWQRDNKYV